MVGRGGGTIEQYGADGLLQRSIRRSVVARTPARDSLDAAAQFWLDAGAGPALGAAIKTMFDGDLPVPEYLPVFEDLLVDEQGFLWSTRFRLPGRLQAVMDVFDPDGVWTGTVTFPERFVLEQIDGDLAIGIQYDDLGVQRVSVHRIEGRPSAR